MKNIIKLIINFFEKLFGIKIKKNNSNNSQIIPSSDIEQDEENFDCSKLKIVPSD